MFNRGRIRWWNRYAHQSKAAFFSSFPIEPSPCVPLLPTHTHPLLLSHSFSSSSSSSSLFSLLSSLLFPSLYLSLLSHKLYKLQAHLFASSHINFHHSYPMRSVLTTLLLPLLAIYSIDCHRKDALFSFITTRDTLSDLPRAPLLQFPSD